MSKAPAKKQPDKLKLRKATVKDLSVRPAQADKLKGGVAKHPTCGGDTCYSVS
jgi:hypothetical protein